ncbi:mechanosensitive ion channel family protein [Algoriphagus sp. A40]|uniref:mechanosensitive ion channel family protein n=1 Tax=Algoriphagus sp. A40 TaxID=1945863 RepID=UPI00111564DA|nr:mechanosensitive ion channel domain-containing protein [Algoriphagus sp. A40]
MGKRKDPIHLIFRKIKSNIFFFGLVLLFSFSFCATGISQQNETIQRPIIKPDSLSKEESTQIKVDTSKSDFIRQIQAIGAGEFARGLDKFESRKIYLRQHELISNLKSENFKLKGMLNKGVGQQQIREKLNEFQQLLPVVLEGISTNAIELQTDRNVAVSAAIFREMLDELMEEKTRVDLFASSFRHSLYRIDSIYAEKDLYLFPPDSLQTRQYAFLLVELNKELQPVEDSVKTFSSKLDSLQTSINALVFELNNHLESLEQLRKNLNGTNFEHEIPTDPNHPFFSRSLSEAISFSFLKEKYALTFYLKLREGRMFVLLLLVLVAWIFLANLKKRTENLHEIDDHDDSKVVLKSPFLSAIVIVLGFFQFFFINPPFIFYWLIWLIASIALTMIFIGYLNRFWMTFWIFTVLVFLISGGTNMLLLPTATERYLILGLSLFGILFLIFTILKNQTNQLKEKKILYFIYLMGLFEFISLMLNVTGRFNLAKSFLLAGYIGIVIGILLLWTVRLVNQGLSIATKIYHNQERELFFINFEKLGNKAPGIFYTFLIVGWGILVGKNFYRFTQISESITEFLTADRTIGSYQFTINGLFVFLIILFVSVLISRLLSLFSAEPEAINSAEQRKRVSFGSWLLLVQIFVISLGLFLAFAASGIPLDKITIILGALSVGIGLGLQGLVNNLVSGLIIAFENTVKVGDLIEVEGKPGIMKSIGFRSSVVNMFEGSTAVIPNGELISKQMINWTTGKGRKLSLVVGVAYGTDLEFAVSLLKEVIAGDLRIRSAPVPRVVPLEFSESSIVLEITFWLVNYMDYPFVKGEIISKVDLTFKANGIRIPFPQRDLYLKTVPEELNAGPSQNDAQNENQG